MTRPSRKGTRRSLYECFYDPALVTDELVEVSYQRAAQPGAQQAFLSTVRTLGTVTGLRDRIRQSLVDNLDRLAMPVLVIWGQQDRLLPVAHAQVAANSIPNVRLHIFDQCGHCPAEEHPEAFVRSVAQRLPCRLQRAAVQSLLPASAPHGRGEACEAPRPAPASDHGVLR